MTARCRRDEGPRSGCRWRPGGVELQGLSGSDPYSSFLAASHEAAADRPSLAGDAADDGTVTLMLTDIENSTALTERLGDEAWVALLRERLGGEHEG